MTDYLEDYRRALRKGDAEKANKLYRKYKDDNEEEGEDEKGSADEPETKFEAPGSMTVGEAKDYVEDLPEEDVESFLESEKENKDRATLVSYLEDLLE